MPRPPPAKPRLLGFGVLVSCAGCQASHYIGPLNFYDASKIAKFLALMVVAPSRIECVVLTRGMRGQLKPPTELGPGLLSIELCGKQVGITTLPLSIPAAAAGGGAKP